MLQKYPEGSSNQQKHIPNCGASKIDSDAVYHISDSNLRGACLQVADKEAGVDCKRILKAAATSRSTSAALKQRFQEGSIDEISFLGRHNLQALVHPTHAQCELAESDHLHPLHQLLHSSRMCP